PPAAPPRTRRPTPAPGPPRPPTAPHPEARGARRPAPRRARLNMTGRHVSNSQDTLAFLGYKIDEKEAATGTFGKSTRAAVVEYQRLRGLPVTGHVEGATLESLNPQVDRANPHVLIAACPSRLRGSVRNEVWVGMGRGRVQVWERKINDTGAMLAERRTHPNGFFDIPSDPPKDAATGQVQVPFQLRVVALDTANNEIGR